MKKAPKFPLKLCANGCGVPPAPPSLVICKACQDKITEFLNRDRRGKEDRE